MRYTLVRPILILSFLALAACDSGDSDGDANDQTDPVQCNENVTFSARVNGSPYCSLPGLTATIFDQNRERLTIQSGSGRTLIRLSLSSLATGTYDLSTTQAGANYSTLSNPDYMTESGTLRISTFSDERIAGTFDFIAVDGDDEVVVTDGAFDLPLPD